MGYFKVTLKGVSWVGGFRAFTRSISFARTIILARILIPSQFGLFAIASLTLSFLEIITETGINIFLIQEEEDIDSYINTAWIISIFRGAIIGLLIFILSGNIAEFFDAPAAGNLLKLVSIVPILRGFINPSVAKFQKELKFGKYFYYNSSVFFVDSLATLLITLYLRSPTGIIWGLIIGALYELVISWASVSPKPVFKFSKIKARKIVKSGKWITMSGIFNYLAGHGDDMVVGKLLGTYSLGIYQLAYKLSTLPLTEITQVFNRVTFPVYTKISKDKMRLKKAFVKTLLVVTVLSVPFGIFLVLSADILIPLLLGEAWSGAAGVLKVLAIFGVIKALTGVPFSLFLSLKKQHYITSILFLELLTLCFLILPFIKLFGLLGAGYATVIAVIIPIPLIFYYLYLLFKKSKAEV